MKNRIPKKSLTEKQLLRLLKRRARKDSTSLSAWANDHDITPQAVSAFVRGTQGAGIQIPNALGYEPLLIYVPVKR